MNETNEMKVNKIANIKGMARKTAEVFVVKIPEFLKFMENSNLQYKLTQTIDKKKFDETHPLYGKTIVLTGFRDPIIIDKIKQVGAKQGSAVSKNTDLVIVKDDMSKNSGKAYEAVKLTIPIMTHDEFIKKYI